MSNTMGMPGGMFPWLFILVGVSPTFVSAGNDVRPEEGQSISTSNRVGLLQCDVIKEDRIPSLGDREEVLEVAEAAVPDKPILSVREIRAG